jgi:hypothetical protein
LDNSLAAPGNSIPGSSNYGTVSSRVMTIKANATVSG